MVTELLVALYFAIGLIVFYKFLAIFDKRHGDGDPEGLDALISLGIACFWPVTVPFYFLYKLFRG